MKKLFLMVFCAAALVVAANAQDPSTPSRPFVVKSKQQVSDITKDIAAKDRNQQLDVFAIGHGYARRCVSRRPSRERSARGS